MIRAACIGASISLLLGCGQQPAQQATASASASTTAVSEVRIRYDEVRNVTYATLLFGLPGGDATAAVHWSGDGELSAPFPLADLRECLTVYGATGYDFAVLADGERFVAAQNRHDEYCVGPDALAAMGTASDVRVSIGSVDGPLPADSRRAIADYLALFR